MSEKYKNYLINLLFPAVVFGSVTGALSAAVISVYKLCAKYIISLSENGYHFFRDHLYYVPIIIIVLFGVALLLGFIYKKIPNIRGGGIPTSIGILRGIISFDWLKNLIGIFMLSLSSFLIGVPLGNEGPAVQMGTAVGRGCLLPFSKKNAAWDRYSMTGGACAGFSVATGAPISGIMFAVEEAHQRISPMIVLVSTVSVMAAYATSHLLAPLLGIETAIFPEIQLMEMNVKDFWIPLAVGVVMGLFAVLFLNYYRVISSFFTKKLKKIPHFYKIFFIFLLTIILGLCSTSFISTGHELMLSLFDNKTAIYMLVIILLVRSSLTLGASSNGITGGLFIPILAVGAVLASVVGKTAVSVFGLGSEYYSVILVLGIAACISGMMKMPITAILFSVEALSCHKNIIYVIAVCAVAFAITEIFDVKSINDSVLESRAEELNKDKKITVIDTFVCVKENSFAVGKQIRDIFWPANLFVLSVKHGSEGAEMDRHGGKEINAGDILHIRYSTLDEQRTKRELVAIIGEQDYNEISTDII